MNATLKSCSVLTLITVGLAVAVYGQASTSTSFQQDYIYGYAPVVMEATKALLTAVPDNTTSPGRAPINQFAYATDLASPAVQVIVDPNADTLYENAWLDLATEPIVLHVPDVAGRYYLIPMLDAYSNVFASIGSRTTGTGEGNYAIVGPQWEGCIPEKVNRIIKAPTNTVWLLGRTLVNGPSDLQTAVAVTRKYQLIPLSAYGKFLETGKYVLPTNVPVTPPNPDFVSLPITNAPGFAMPEFFNVLGDYAAENPPPADQLAPAAALVSDGLANEDQLNSTVASQAYTTMADYLRANAIPENGWLFNPHSGSYGANYLLRAAVAKFGPGANIAADAVYMHAINDVSGAPLNGTNSYVIHFAPGQTPPERGFWSITPYDHGALVPNLLNRYDVGSQTGLVFNPDGSLDIFLQSTEPQTMQNNWLAIPAGPFDLTLRIYWPDASIVNREWDPPTLSFANAPLP